MKLLASPGSPYARKVRIVLAEKGIPCEYVIARPSDPDSGVVNFNPLVKVPVLVRDDGKALYDSVVIVEYFDHLGTGPKLVPEKFEDRIEVKRLEALGDGITDCIVALTHDSRFSDTCDQNTDWYQKQLQKIERGLAVLQSEIGAREFCFGAAFTLGDISAGCALGYLDRAYAGFDWRNKFSGLKRYADKLFARASFASTLPPKG